MRRDTPRTMSLLFGLWFVATATLVVAGELVDSTVDAGSLVIALMAANATALVLRGVSRLRT